MEPYGIALIGCGTVGGGVVKLLLEAKADVNVKDSFYRDRLYIAAEKCHEGVVSCC